MEPLVQAFHQFTTCFFNIPSRYSALSVNGAYLALMMVHPSCLNRQGSIKAAWQAANSPGYLPSRYRKGVVYHWPNPWPRTVPSSAQSKLSKAMPSLGYHHLWLAIPSHCYAFARPHTTFANLPEGVGSWQVPCGSSRGPAPWQPKGRARPPSALEY